MMKPDASRRSFLQWSAGTVAGAGATSWIGRCPAVSAKDTRLDPEMVQLSPEMEPLVRFIEECPRDRLLEETAARIQRGLTYRELLAGLLLAGVRNVEPRPSVGFKFHAVLVVNSAHLASLSSPDEHRWLPIFWALDYFKSSQARDERERGWTMAPVDESRVPRGTAAKTAFRSAMQNWDEGAADAAVAAMARTRGANEVFEEFFRFGARDFRSIGHKAIFVANSWRTLQCIGWRHAEPVLRSLAYALLNHEGDNPAGRDAEADRPWRVNQERVADFPEDWMQGRQDDGATQEVLDVLHEGPWEDSCASVLQLIQKGVAPTSVWDGLLAGAGELLVRQPGIVALHALTTTNAMRFAFDATADDETRRLLLLQNAAFLPMFREAMRGRGDVSDFRMSQWRTASEGSGDASPESILDAVSRDRMDAANQVIRYLQAGGEAKPLIDAARVMVFLKGNDSHDYKFSSAVLEDYYHASSGWREPYLAASVFRLRGSGDRDNPLVDRTRQALSATGLSRNA